MSKEELTQGILLLSLIMAIGWSVRGLF